MKEKNNLETERDGDKLNEEPNNLKNQKEYADYNKILNFFKDYSEDLKVDIDYFFDFCRFLNIPPNIRDFVRNLISNIGDYFNTLWNSEKFRIYIAAFYVSYVLLEQKIDEFEYSLNSFVKKLIKKIEDEKIWVSPKHDLISFLKSVINAGYEPERVINFLTAKQNLQLNVYYYKIQLSKLIKKMQRQHKKLLYYHLNEKVLYGVILYVLGKCFDSFRFSQARLCASFYYILSKHQKWKNNEIPMEVFSYIGSVKNIDFQNAYESIISKIDYNDLMIKYPNYNFSKESDACSKDINEKTEVKIIKEKLKKFKGWRMAFF